MVDIGKTYVAINASSTTAAATATGVIDTLGFDYASVDVILTTSDAATNNPSVLKLAQCDTSNGSFTDITALVGDGTGGFTVPNCVTEGNWTQRLECDMCGKKRWLKVSVSPLTTQSVTAVARLMRGKTAADGTTDAGVNGIAFG